MKNAQSQAFEQHMMAVTFAEAGEFDSAAAFLQRRSGRRPPGSGTKARGGNAGKALLLGLLSLALYAALFANETAVLELSRQGHWWAALPVAVAFVFSVAHGAFTHEFWDSLGVKARK